MMRAIAIVAASSGCLIAPPKLCDGPYDTHTQVLGPEINAEMMTNDSPFLTRDRLELYFARTGSGFQLFYSHRDTPTAAWAPATVIPFAQNINASNPFVTADRSTLYFTVTGSLMKLVRTASTGQFDGTPSSVDRPMAAGSMSMTDDQLDIYYENNDPNPKATYHAHRSSVDFDFPVNGTLVEGLAALGETTSPAISSDGRVMLVANSGPGKHEWRAIGSGDTFTVEADPIEPLTVNTYDGSLTDDTIMIYARGAIGAQIVTVERQCNN